MTRTRIAAALAVGGLVSAALPLLLGADAPFLGGAAFLLALVLEAAALRAAMRRRSTSDHAALSD